VRAFESLYEADREARTTAAELISSADTLRPRSRA